MYVFVLNWICSLIHFKYFFTCLKDFYSENETLQTD